MNWTNLFKISLKALSNNKMRAFLTMLGIIIGVAAVITMIALGQGTKQSIQKEISDMGSNIIMVHPGGDRRGGVRMDPSEMQTLKVQNYEALKDDPLIDATTIGLKGSPTNIFKSFTPPQKGAGMMLEGADKATCEQLAEILAKKHII